MIIALTGEKLAGKDTVAEYLVSKHGAAHIRHSHILDEILTLLDLPISRRNEIDLGMGLRKVFGDGILGKALAKRVKDAQNQIIVINGVRFQDEVDNAVALGAKLIYVTAPEETRFERFKNRTEKHDDAQGSLEDFQKQEQEPTEIGIPSIGKQASIVIQNTGSLDELYAKVDNLITQLNS